MAGILGDGRRMRAGSRDGGRETFRRRETSAAGRIGRIELETSPLCGVSGGQFAWFRAQCVCERKQLADVFGLIRYSAKKKCRSSHTISERHLRIIRSLKYTHDFLRTFYDIS